MQKLITRGLMLAGGLYLGKTATCYILAKYKKEIRGAIITKAASYFFDIEPDMKEEDDPVKVALMAYLDAKKKGA